MQVKVDGALPGYPTPIEQPDPTEVIGPTCWLTAYLYGPLSPPLWTHYGVPGFDFEDHTFTTRYEAEEFFLRHNFCHHCGQASGFPSASAYEAHWRTCPGPTRTPVATQLSLFEVSL